jgi:uncharacterized protein YegP (UPF0339 family)
VSSVPGFQGGGEVIGAPAALLTRYEIHQEDDGLWYWRMVAANDEVIAQGSRGYMVKGEMLQRINLVRVYGAAAQVREV